MNKDQILDSQLKLLILAAVIVTCFGCGKRANSPTVPQSKPVIQPEKIEPPAHFKPSKKAALPYFEKTTIEAYRKIGARNPKWDANAEIALRFWAYQICEDGSVANGPEFKVMRAATAQALKDGCDDPLVMYVAVRSDRICPNPDRLVRVFVPDYYTRIIGAFSKHPYPPIRQGLIYQRGAEEMLGITEVQQMAESKQKATDWLNQAADKIAEIDLGEVDRDEFNMWTCQLMDDYRSATGDRKQGYDRITVALEKNPSNKGIIPLRVAGAFYKDWAWDARGNGLADSVTETGWKLFSERLAIARKALEEAWSKDPMDAFVCTTMINVAAGECKPVEMEEWFQRGKKADPNCYGLYAAKLHFLQPQWGGSEEEMLELGRECLREGRWDERIPFMLVGAHEVAGKSRSPDLKDHFQKPGVWEDVEGVYKEYLSRFPENYGEKSAYAYHAGLAGKWAFANQLLDELGTNVVSTGFGGLGRYFTFSQEIRSHRNSQ